MIPKIIHYCWFGKNKKNDLINACALSWCKYLKGYDIVEWNEDNFDLNRNLYVKQAYEAKKWAFVSDYVRLYVLFHNGGIYLDTDVEVFRSFDQFLIHKAFTGFEYCYGKTHPVTAVMGAVKCHVWIGSLLKEYEDIAFIKNGQLNLMSNTTRISAFLNREYAVKNDDKYQVVGDDLHIYPSYFFCRKTKRSFSVHHMDASWNNPLRRKISKIIRANKLFYTIYSSKHLLGKLF
jgi:mannosyltransferase OCH1-like enzyme